MGRVSKGVKCSVIGCDKPAVRSLSPQRIPSALRVEASGRRAYLCRDHYKEFKKLIREEKLIERWRYMH